MSIASLVQPAKRMRPVVRWGVSVSATFLPHYLVNAWISGEKLPITKFVFSFSLQLLCGEICHSKKHSARRYDECTYRGADKSLVRAGRKQANVFVRMAWISFGALPCRGKWKLDGSSRLDVVEIAGVHDMLPSLFHSLSRLRTFQHPGSSSH